MMVSGSSISANLVPLVGTFDLGYLFTASRSRPRRSTPARRSRSRRRCSRAPISASSPGPTISARAACWRARRCNDAGRSRRAEDPHAAQSGHHRMPAPDGRGRDADGVRRDLHRAAGRRARRAGARSADHRRQQVLRDREILLADPAQLLAACDLFQRRRPSTAWTGEAARWLPRRRAEGRRRHPRARARGREGGARRSSRTRASP